jgi:site-specific recombinase XerD
VKSVGRLNNILIKEKARAQDAINRMYDNKQLRYLSIQQVKKGILRKSSYDSFFDFGEEKIKELTASRRYGTARSYQGLLGILKVFTKGKDVRFNEVNYDFLKRFEMFHLSKEGNTLNGVAAYMRVLKSIYNKGIKEGMIEREAYPFYQYQIKTLPTAKRAVDIKYIKRILELELEEGSKLFHYRNYFLISFMLYGMPFIDMAFLKLGNMVNGRIRYHRRKTSRMYDIKIPDQLWEILDYYCRHKEEDDFILNIVTRTVLSDQYKDIDWERHRYNKGLKKIAELCGIEQRLTSYVSRHSFATQAMLLKIPLEAISAMMGHSKINTTQIYLKSLPTTMLDQYNEKLVLSL